MDDHTTVESDRRPCLRFVYQTDEVRVELGAPTIEEMAEMKAMFLPVHICGDECEHDREEDGE